MTRWEMAEIIKGKDEEIEDHKYALGEWRKMIDHQKSEIAKFQQEVIDLKSKTKEEQPKVQTKEEGNDLCEKTIIEKTSIKPKEESDD